MLGWIRGFQRWRREKRRKIIFIALLHFCAFDKFLWLSFRCFFLLALFAIPWIVKKSCKKAHDMRKISLWCRCGGEKRKWKILLHTETWGNITPMPWNAAVRVESAQLACFYFCCEDEGEEWWRIFQWVNDGWVIYYFFSTLQCSSWRNVDGKLKPPPPPTSQKRLCTISHSHSFKIPIWMSRRSSVNLRLPSESRVVLISKW